MIMMHPEPRLLDTQSRSLTYPLAYNQKALWFLQKLNQLSAAYNIVVALRARTRLEPDALRGAFQRLVDRHAALRTTFPEIDGEPRQAVHEQMKVAFRVEDARTWSEADLDDWLAEEAYVPFDLEHGPLFRVTMLAQPAGQSILVLATHHIVTDMWSQAIVLSEVPRLYQAEVAGLPTSIKPPRVEYVDHAAAQMERLDGPEAERHWQFWQEQLAGDLPVLDLPLDRPRRQGGAERGAAVNLSIPAELAEQLRVLAKAHGTTLESVVLAAYQVLLHRYTGQEDILAGVTRAGRTAQTARTIGYFVNPVVLRGDLTGDPSFSQFLARLGATVKAVGEHEAYPLARIVERLQLQRDPSRSPLFQVMFSWQKTTRLVDAGSMAGITIGVEGAGITQEGIDLEWFPLRHRPAPFDLSLLMAEAEEGLVGVLEYKIDLFEAATIERMAGHFLRLLGGIVADPTQPVSRLPILTEHEIRQLSGWNDTSQPFPADTTIHQLFEAQASRTPDAVAVAMGNERLTYRELDQQADQLAHRLHLLGIGSGSLVGVLLDRSPLLIVAVLGVLKAGAAYVPLDPRFPQQRLAFMLADAGASIVLTQAALWHRLAASTVHALCLDEDQPDRPAQAVEDQATGDGDERCPGSRAVSADSLAYIIYTSGSTGEPKGVPIKHRGLCNLVTDQVRDFGVGPGSRVLQFASPSFDASVSEIFMALTSGATLVLAPQDVLASPAELLYLLRNEAITTVTLPPSMLRALPDADLPELQTMIAAGESCPVAVAERWKPGRRFFNAYGPTEATIGAACYRVEELPAAAATVPIGRPIANTKLYLLDVHLQMVPIGVPGELYIGGVGVASGYHHRPELTAAKFVSYPPMSPPLRGSNGYGDRLYRTGDLARRLPDGSIEYLGRRDNQVKLRGFRVELEEIEAVLARHAAVQEVAVAVLPGGRDADDVRLVAYLVLQPDEHVTSVDLRSFLEAGLPEYMVPSAFVLVDRLPRTPSGKLDRRALADLQTGRPLTARGELALPRTPVEMAMLDIWRDILEIDAIGIHDSFFDDGGHWLLATQVMSRVRDVFGVDLPLRSLFEAPTAAQLSEQIVTALQEGRRVPPSQVVPVARDQPLPLGFSQERMWLVHQLQPHSSAYNIPVAVRLQGHLDVATLARALDELVARHEVLRTRIVTVGGRPVQEILPHLALPLAIRDLSALPADEHERAASDLCQQHAREPFDLQAGPLLRAQLLRLDLTHHVLQVTLHHAIADAWSVRIAAEELTRLYANIAGGETVPLPPPQLQYADFAFWQHQNLQSADLAHQLAYWKKKLADVPVLSLPTDHPRPPIQSTRGSIEYLDVEDQVLEDLRTLSHGENVTLFMTFLAAFNVLLYRYSLQTDIALGVPIANRHWTASEQLLGTLVNTLVLRTQFEPGLPFRRLLQRVREAALEAYAHQDLPFEQLVSAIRPKRDLSHAPLFQVMFDYTNVPMPVMEMPGLLWSPMEVDRGAAQLDLTLSVVDTQQLRRVSIEYSTDLFEAETIKRMLGHLHQLLKEILVEPDQLVAQIPIVTAAERRQLLVEWNATEADTPQDVCLHELVEAQAQRTPEAVAVVFGEKQLTYGQLDSLAERLAAQLRLLGVGPDVTVGICISRSLEMIVGLLGILKAGGAYVPLDPTFPEERLRYIISDAQMPVLLTESSLRLAHRLVGELDGHKPRIVELDKQLHESRSSPSRLIAQPPLRPENLAYVMYTSGSTGKPKGVEVPHRAVVNFLLSMARQPGLAADDVWLAVTTLSFDISVLELFLPLAVGARVVLIDKEERQDSRLLAARLASSGATVMQATPAMWRMLVESGWAGDGRLKMLCGGEALPADLATALFERGGELWNMYGPTETTVWSMISRIDWADDRITIGRPIANTKIYIVDSQGEPVPVGIAGELWIGGAGVARGYRHLPERTHARFIQDPFCQEPGARVYRTGDLARYLPDGRIEYLGRLDYQVKVRGFRIELAEIESCLNQHSAVRQAVVTTQRDVLGQNCLAAYVLLQPDASELTAEENLRRHLRDLLPDYMIPTAFVFLDAFPLTPNGKVDRKELPEPSHNRLRAPSSVLPPRTSIEAVLQQMWQDLLQINPISITDDFFELGGHSLLAVRLFAQVEAVFNMRLPLTVLYEEATIEHLAQVIDEHDSITALSSLVALQPQGSIPPFFCVHGITGDLLWFGDLARQLAPDQPFYGLESPGLHGASEPPADIPTLAADYLALIRSQQPAGPYFLGGASFGGIVAFEMAQQLQAQGESVALLAIFDHEPPNVDGLDSTPSRVKSVRYLAQFIRNLPRWAIGLRDLTARQIWSRVNRYRLLGIGAGRALVSRAPAGGERIEVNQIIDYAEQLPEHRQRLIEVHHEALRSYTPGPYRGRITLFKSRVRPLFGVYDPETRWQRLAVDPVEVITVEGSHEGMFKGAHAKALAAALRMSIARARQM